MLRWLLLASLLIPVAAAHEVHDDAGDQTPDAFRHLDVLAVRLNGTENLTLEVEFAALDADEGWDLVLYLNRTTGGHVLQCSSPHRGCTLVDRPSSNLEAEVPGTVEQDGNVLRLTAPFDAWSASDFQVTRVDLTIRAQAGTAMSETPLPFSSDELDAQVTWAFPAPATEATGPGSEGDDRVPANAMDGDATTDRKIPAPMVGWLLLALAGVRR